MRGEQDSQVELLTTTSPGKRVPATHPIREIKRLADQALAKLDSTFDAMYSSIGRPSIPPERLLNAQLLIALYSVRSERQFCERLDYDLPWKRGSWANPGGRRGYQKVKLSDLRRSHFAP
jgi:hypothetical protein